MSLRDNETIAEMSGAAEPTSGIAACGNDVMFFLRFCSIDESHSSRYVSGLP
jgi:hypothetical protein